MTHGIAAPLLASQPRRPLAGHVHVPGDKSISHRALLLGALARGATRIVGLLEGEDVLRTAAAAIALGARVERQDDGAWLVEGAGLGALAEPTDILDLGNAGTATRLLMGVLAGHPITATLTGDASLRRRPMARVIEPLEQMGARFMARSGARLPLTMTGRSDLLPLTWRLPVPSAQVKSAILLAGLGALGRTTAIEPEPTRDHTELMLRAFGADVRVETDETGARHASVEGLPRLKGQAVTVPRDPSSAAFPMVAALLVPGSAIRLPRVGMNPHRTGLFTTLQEMGARISIEHPTVEVGEPVADIAVAASALRGVTVPAARAPSMIDEYPVLAVAAACATGTTRMEGLAELRVKESDRLARIAEGLLACGAHIEVEGDTLIVHGTGRPPPGGAMVATAFDHRIAMAFLVLGQVTEQPVAIDDATAITTSFPDFVALMTAAGARIAPPGQPHPHDASADN